MWKWVAALVGLVLATNYLLVVVAAVATVSVIIVLFQLVSMLH